MGIAILRTEILGLLREVVFVRSLARAKTWTVLIRVRVLDMLRDLFAERRAFHGVRHHLLAPESRKRATNSGVAARQRNRESHDRFMSTVTLFGMIFVLGVIHVPAPGFAPDKASADHLLTRIMFPFILLVLLAALLMGMLNAKDVFGVPAMASSFFNLGSIIGGAGFGYLLYSAFRQSRADRSPGLAMLLAGSRNCSWQAPLLVRIGFTLA